MRINKEVEYDIENYQGRGLCYPPKAEVFTQTEIILDIIRKPDSIIVLLYIQKLKRKQSHFVYAFKNMEFSRTF
jgi:hypothetical protein